jgi:truncated hemoglobin YjbI
VNPKRHLTTIVDADAATIARLEAEVETLHRIYQRAFEDWLDCRDALKDARMQAEDAEELVDAVTRAERMTA